MAMSETVKQRIRDFLAHHDAGVRAEVLAYEALGLRGAVGAIADKVVRAAVAGDPGFVCDSGGMWYLKSSGRETALREIAFVCVGLVPSANAEVHALAGRKVQMDGRETLFPPVRIRMGERAETWVSYAEFAKDAVLVGFQWPKVQRAVNGLSRAAMGEAIAESGICLFRLGRRFYPDVNLHGVEDLAAAIGLSFVADRGAEGEASLQADVLLHLLGQCASAGIQTLEALTAALYPDPVPVRFDAYAFDEAFLSALPESPGVYIMRDREGRAIYVGKAVNLRTRVGSYFANRAERPEKTRRILDRIWSMEVETVGSELEALLLEAKLIALCQPEFNTQVDVHSREVDLGANNQVLILPSSEPECVELFCIADGTSFQQVRARKDLRDWEAAQRRLYQLYFDAHVEPDLETGAPFEILKSWLGAKRDSVNWVDMDSAGSADNALRIVSEYVQHCEDEAWEKISWRV